MSTQNPGDTVTGGGPKPRGLGFVPGPGQPELEARERIATANLDLHRAQALAAPAYPAAFDWRDVNGSNYITPIRDQGGCGSCVAFGTIGAVEGTLRVSEHNPNLPIDLSEAQLFYCYAEARDGRNCDIGWWPDRALHYIQTDGVVDEVCFPYTDHDQPCKLCSDSASRSIKIASAKTLRSPADMKNWISTNGPLIACFTVYEDFYDHYSNGIYHYDKHSKAVGGHCVSVVGYNEAQQYWICKNQWGIWWGEHGYFRIGYGEVGIDSEMFGVVVVTQTPVVTWANLADIVYGTPLGAAQLNATASVAGTFAYHPAGGTLLHAGSGQVLSTTFTATSPKYQQVTATTHINVVKATPVIHWPHPADIVYGTPLGLAQLNATASVPGTFFYTPAAGTVLHAGAGQHLTALFVPSDAANYNVVSATVQINVLKATPAITWSNPTDLDYGTPLDASQLNATASVPGTLVYNPPAGVVLNIGLHQALCVDFTPLDTSDYDPASATVYVNILTGTPIIVAPPTFQPVVLNEGDRVLVSVTIKNDSIKPHSTQGPDPGFQYNEGDTFVTKGFPPVAGAFRIGVDLEETTYAVDHLYRWGFGKTLAPGETVVVTGSIRFPNSRHNGHYYVGLVQESVKWIADHEGTTSLTVNPP